MMSAATNGYKRLHGLTVEQQNAVDLLVTGRTDAEAADAVGVHRVTITRWRLHDAHFQAALNRRRQEVWGESLDRLRALVPQALAVLEERLASETDGLRAAIQIVRLAGLH